MRQALHRIVASAVVVGCGAVCAPQTTEAQPVRRGLSAPVTQTVAMLPGRLDGLVTDDHGVPLAGAAISAQGAGLQFAVTDERGRFAFQGLRPGPYFVRATVPGYTSSKRELIDIPAAAAAWRAFRLSPLLSSKTPAAERPVAAAGFGAPGEPTAVDAGGDDHSHSPMAWRVRHLRRPVLRDQGQGADGVGGDDHLDQWLTDGAIARANVIGGSFTPSWLGGLPLSGRLQFLTTSAFDSAQQLFDATALPSGVAYVAIGSTAGKSASWDVQAAISQGDLSSWVVTGRYEMIVADRHSLDVGGAYAMQSYDGRNTASLAALAEGNRNVGSFHVYDRWALAQNLSLTLGTRYARYGYVEGAMMFSPSASVRWSPLGKTWIRGSISQEMTAPGAEEFVPTTVAGLWLPPQRTFAPVGSETGFRPERTRHYEIGIERELGSFLVSGRAFKQTVDDQIVTLFDLELPDASRADLGHYYTAGGGDVDAVGWGVGISRPVASRVRGSVSYSVIQADWTASPTAVWVRQYAPSARRPPAERIHDLTTTIETDIPETATRFFAVYRLNTGFTSADVWRTVPGFGARFDVQVSQGLPFMGFTQADWELLVAVRNLFRDDAPTASVYDELLVVRPPKRIVGGLMVKF
jgi:hypothetical protein